MKYIVGPPRRSTSAASLVYRHARKARDDVYELGRRLYEGEIAES